MPDFSFVAKDEDSARRPYKILNQLWQNIVLIGRASL
jgi:hypothetical protein